MTSYTPTDRIVIETENATGKIVGVDFDRADTRLAIQDMLEAIDFVLAHEMDAGHYDRGKCLDIGRRLGFLRAAVLNLSRLEEITPWPTCPHGHTDPTCCEVPLCPGIEGTGL